jgi:hypothetical protein
MKFFQPIQLSYAAVGHMQQQWPVAAQGTNVVAAEDVKMMAVTT